MSSEIDRKDVKDQYYLLDILDNKASALLTFNAIFLAALAIWLGYIALNILHFILDAVFLALLYSCYRILRTIQLKWSEGEESAKELDTIRHTRTKDYQRAWRVSMYSIIVVILVTIIHSIGTLLITLGLCTGYCEVFYSKDVFGGVL